MANIKISELNELLPGQKAYDDYLAIVDSSADETKKISVETLTSTGVKLIAVSSTEPIEFSNGDKYYNSTTNRIYEARTDVWYNPQEPVEGIFYIIFDSQSIYTYDKTNETLVSVGGGSNIEIVNNYSTSQTDGYSCNYLNNSIVETGSNTNGTYIKYGNGIMICTKSVSSSINVNTEWGGLYEGKLALGSWAEEFISVPIVNATNTSASGLFVESFNPIPTATSAGSIYLARPTSGTHQANINLIAIGRWK